MMRTLLTVLTLLAMLATVVTLGVGVFSMLNPKISSQKSNKIMRLRIFFQVLALLFFSALLLYSHH
jgi:hypoxia induced protein